MDKAEKSIFHLIMDPLSERMITALAVLMFSMFALLALYPIAILGLLL